MAVPRRPRFVLQVLRSAGRSVVTLPIVLYTALQHSLQVRDKRAGELEGLFFHGQSVHLTPTHTTLQRTRPAQTYATRVLERQRDKTARKLCMATAECDAAAASRREKVAVSIYTKMHIYVPQVNVYTNTKMYVCIDIHMYTYIHTWFM